MGSMDGEDMLDDLYMCEMNRMNWDRIGYWLVCFGVGLYDIMNEMARGGCFFGIFFSGGVWFI